MKKVLVSISAALLVVLLALTMAGCDKSGNIQKAYENEGYTVTRIDAQESTALKTLLGEEAKDELDKYAVFVCTKGLQSVTFVKFPSADTIKEILGEDGYDKAVKSGFVNGNCYLLIPGLPGVNDIFKNA
ncbi:MAG: hypothetical protein K2L42_02465 [Clostridia bacterium]|nr:hypothetical protein [Clostridia bacterium]